MGAAPLGNLYKPVSDAEALETIETGLDLGIRYIDTAPYYGFGLSEQRVGEGIGSASDVVISSKVGRILRPATQSEMSRQERHGFVSPMPFEPEYDYSRSGVLRSYEASVRRLGRVDILYIHDIGRRTHGEADSDYRQQLLGGGGLEALDELRRAGDVSGIGLGVNEIEVCLELMDLADLDVILLAGRYTLLEQAALEALFPRCLAAGTSIVVGGPFNSGILAAGSAGAGNAHFDYGPVPAKVRERVARLETVCSAHEVPLPAAALQFPLAHPVVAAVIPGMANTAEVRSNMGFFRVPIPRAFWDDLRSEGLIDERAPIPREGGAT
jgi:D-threo-aldose 1-dehydrogenase